MVVGRCERDQGRSGRDQGRSGPDQADLWTVVGGQETGGIVVREGVSLESKELGERLSTGAIISAKVRRGIRVCYTMISGTGPASGWVSIRMQCTDQIVKLITAGAGGPKEKKPTPKVLDPMELALVRARSLGAESLAMGGLESKLRAPLELTKAECMAGVEAMMLLGLQPHIQRELYKRWDAVKGDHLKFEFEQRRTCVLAAGPVLETMGLDASWEGVCKHRSTYLKTVGKDLFEDDDQLKRQIIARWLQTPEYQQTLPYSTADIHDFIISLRDPEAAHAPAKSGGMVAHWQFDVGHLEVVSVNSKLRVIFIADGQSSRGELFMDDVWHRALLSNGVSIRLRRSDTPMKLLISLEGACGWLEECAAHVLDECEITPCSVLQRQAVTVVRRLAKNWSMAAAGPPQEPELLELVPRPLGQLACSESDARKGLVGACIGLVESNIARGTTGLIYASSAGLWFDWWVIESLQAKGFGIASVHFISASYTESARRDAGMHPCALGDMAAWCHAVCVRAYAHESLQDFVKLHPKEAHVLVQPPDFEPLMACGALREDGLLVSSTGWKYQDAPMTMVPI